MPLEIDREARAEVSASPRRCLELLADVERYPSWSSLITAAERDGERVRLRASVLGVELEMDCGLIVRDGGAVLHRIPSGSEDDERFEAAWKLSPGAVGLHVRAVLDAPGPARLIRGRVERRIVDDLLADFTRAL